MANHNDLGKEGEQLARTYLEKKGYSILYCNWRTKKIEIDIIAKTPTDIVFIEVKTRMNTYFGAPESAVGLSKQKQIIKGAHIFLTLHAVELNPRFDIVSIVLNSKRKEIQHIESAFYPSL